MEEQKIRVKELENDISEQEKEIDRERNEQIEIIRELNQKLDEQTETNVIIEKEFK